MTDPDTDHSGPFVDLFAKFNLSLSSLSDEIRLTRQENGRREQARLASQPNYVPLQRMSVPGAAVTDLQDFGGPQPGRQWEIRLLTAYASPLAVNATLVTWYVGQIMPGPAAGMLPATMARWQFASVPAQQNFTSDVIKVYPGERLIAGLTGIPANSVIALNASIADQPMQSARFSVSSS